MRDRIEIANNLQLGGLVTVQLRNKRGKVIKEIKEHNFLGTIVPEIQNFMQRNVIGFDLLNGFSTSRSLVNLQFSGPYVNYFIQLTDSDSYPDPNLYPHVNRSSIGNLIGYANEATYSGSDTLRGTINTAESCVTEKGIKLVYDWPTHAANGTIKSICFINENLNIYWKKKARVHSSGAVIDGKFYTYFTNNNYFGYLTPTGYAVDLFPKPAALNFSIYRDASQVAYDGTYWYVVNYQNFFKLDNSGNVVLQKTLPRSSMSMVYLDGYLYLVDYNARRNLYKYDTNGNEIGLYLIAPADIMRMSVFNGYIVMSHTDYWYRMYKDGVFLWLQMVNNSAVYNNSFTIFDNMLYLQYYSSDLNHSWYIYPLGRLISRVVLPQPIVKTSANTLKVIYEFNYY